MDGYESTLVFFVNGKKVVEDNVDPSWTLLHYLRTKLRLCGTKLGCAEGGCGACTVMVSKYHRTEDKVRHIPVNACLAPVCSMHGLAVTTVEGIGSVKSKLHPVQERIAKSHGSQCGFCTPGIVMSMYTLLRNMPKPSMKDLEVTFQGNLCRCTGYRPIIEAYKTFTEDWEKMRASRETNGNVCGIGKDCCKLNAAKEEESCNESEFVPFHESQEPIFPPELKLKDQWDKQRLRFKSKEISWFRPTDLDDLLKLKSQFPEAKIVVGNTEIGIETKFKHLTYPVLIQPSQVTELEALELTGHGLRVGAAVTLEALTECLQEKIRIFPEERTRVFKVLVEALHSFGGKQIRSVACVGGNIITGSPISDLNPIFLAAKVELELRNVEGSRRVMMDDKFFTSYRKTILQEDEILIGIILPFSEKQQYIYAHKQSRRRDDDIAIVNAAINVKFFRDTIKLMEISMAFGGLAPTTKLITKWNEVLGREWNGKMLKEVYKVLHRELVLDAGAPGGMIEYRKALPLSFFLRTFIAIKKELNQTIHSRDLSALEKFSYRMPKSSQMFQTVPFDQEHNDSVGRPMHHVAAEKQATGEAIFFDDLPRIENEAYLAYVYSAKAFANVTNIDASEALAMEGVVGFICAEDIKAGCNKLGPVVADEEVFITKQVTCQYQLLGAIVADNQQIAQKAARNVKVEYEELSPVIISIEDAIKYNSFFDKERKIESGDVDEAFKSSTNVIEGVCRSGYQEHFYLETHGCLVVPKEVDDLEIYTSSQHHAEITDLVSRILNIPQNRIVTKIKRIGGGFGGKQSRGVPIAVTAAIAANKFRRPIRIMLDRDEDMASTGGRHPFLTKYKAAFDENGKILAYEAEMFANAGCSLDLSLEVMERAVFHIENAYKIDNLRVIGKICRTNLPSNTAFRGFGAPQAMFVAENMIRNVSEFLQIDHVDVAKINLYREGDATHYNQRLINCNLIRCLEECVNSSRYAERKSEIRKYNKENRWKKRGISVVCTKYGVGFGVPFLEQAGALVNVYTDGSVLLTHSGVEMGQGLNTKMIQVASRVLGIPAERIYISETSTDKVPNSSPSAASVGSDLNGVAVKNACEMIMDRLKTIIIENPTGQWNDWIKAAYFNRISLSATGYYYTPDIFYDWNKNTGTPYNYFTYGVACTEVEIDCLTGDHQLLRTDIVMDLGASLNPAIDIGQIEGAFMQGYGLFVLEEMVYSPSGTMLTKGPGSYKIPGFGDIPVEFNVSLLKDVGNPKALYSSKAVGEPPLFLASSALFAIREAIKFARAEGQLSNNFRLDAPATAEKICMLCQEDLTSKNTYSIFSKDDLQNQTNNFS